MNRSGGMQIKKSQSLLKEIDWHIKTLREDYFNTKKD